MQQRQLRLGDILDDYCPRERRITNHAVVAMIDQEVKQTRCTTCDSDHEYKHAKVPPARRKKETMSAAFSEVLASVQPEAAVGTIRMPDSSPEKAAPKRHEVKPPLAEEPAAAPIELAPEPAPSPVEPAVEPAPAAGADEQSRIPEEEGPVHRRLIRATLPRSDAPVARPMPQFTMREPAPRGGHFRAKGAHRPHQQGAGARPHGRPPLPKHAGGARKGGFGQHPRPARPGHGALPSRPGKKHSR